jgi:hypothetical protein
MNSAIESQAVAGLIISNFDGMLKDYFDTGLFSPKADKDAKKNPLGIFSTAASGDETQMDAAASLFRVFEKIPKSVREEWNKNDRLNSGFSDAKTLSDLTDAVKALIQSTDGLTDEMKKGLLMEFQ